MQIHTAQDPDSLAADAAAFIRRTIDRKLATGERFTLVLSGGNTPRRTYQQLADDAGSLDWSRVHFFWGDERCVPHDHPDSNFRMARETLLDALAVPAANLHPMDCAGSPQEGARSYQAELRAIFPVQPFPRFDFVLLGLGDDGHTASLFPGTAALQEHERWVVANHVEKLDAWRMTLTYPVLNASAAVAFLVEGPAKAGIVRQIIRGPQGRYPAQAIAPDGGELHWFLDRAASSGLSPDP